METEVNVVIWLVVVAVMLLIEIFTMGLTTLWFSIGAVAAATATWFGAPLWLQVLLFVVVSLAVMLSVRPFAMRVVNKDRLKTNVDAIIGEQAVVMEEIDNHRDKGKAELRGVEWTARSVDGSVIPAEELVVVERVSGVKLYVAKQEK